MSVKKILYNGLIITIDKDHPTVEAVGIEDEKIIAVGKFEDVKKTLEPEYDLIDLKGKTLLPGFIDSHMHPLSFMFLLLNLDLSEVKSLKELQELLRDACAKRINGEFILALKLKEEEFDVPKLPTRWEIDEVCPNNPVFIVRYDGHIGIANSKALELGEIDSNSIDPEGGEIRRNIQGELTGVLSENALALLFSKIEKYLVPEPGILREFANKAFGLLAKNGITSIHGQLNEGRIPIYKMIQDNILQNWYAFVSIDKPKKLVRLKNPPLDGGKEDSKFKIGTLKLFLDGTFGAKTACMWEPFTDAPNSCGFCVVDEEEMYEKMKIAHNDGFQIAIHVIGDKGNRICVDLYKRLLTEFPRENHRHRIEHASMLTEDVLNDMKEYGIIASCQPPFINSEYTWLEKRIGKERCKYTYPMKSIIDAGIILISGSDCPVEEPNVIMGLHALVDRNGFVPEQCISIEEALKTYTINAAYAAFEENIKGSIEVGKLADFVILDKNPLETPKDMIRKIKVLETIIRGESVFKKV
ncbi:MAG: amidohydrolase [Candidatus Lokiarchaeota archaeon]|nr:amidohydrolase [Candidatus Lokiarchaeota archaeon]